MPARRPVARRPGGLPVVLRMAVALAFPFVAALTVAGTYLGLELIVCAAWVAFAMVTLYLLSAYPTLLQSLGFLTVNNLLGVGFLIALTVQVLNSRDLSFLRVPQVL